MKCVIPNCNGTISQTERGAVCDTCGATNILGALSPNGKKSPVKSDSGRIIHISLSYKSWMDRTFVATNIRGRSKRLKVVDEKFKAYESAKNASNIQALMQAFESWKGTKKLTWAKSSRNKKGAISELDAYIRQELKSQGKLAATTGGIQEDETEADHQRLGVLYLLGNIEISNIPQAKAKQIFSSALSVASVTGNSIESIEKNYASAHSSVSSGQHAYAPRSSSSATSLSDDLASAFEFNPKESALGAAVGTYTDSSKSGASSIPQHQLETWKQNIKRQINKVMNDLWEKLKPLLTSSAVLAAKTAIAYGITELIKKLFGITAALGGTVVETIISVCKTIKAVWIRWKAKGLLNKSRIKAGHASIMVGSIFNEMTSDIWSGLKAVASGVFDGAALLLTAGAGIIVTLVKAVIIAIIDVVKLFQEISGAKRILKEAKQYWLQNADYRNNRGGSMSARQLIHRNPVRFNVWFKIVCDESTPLAALCINSGICTNLFSMLDTSTSPESSHQKDFNNTNTAVIYIKNHGVDYLKSSNLKLISQDHFISQTIRRIMTGKVLMA